MIMKIDLMDILGTLHLASEALQVHMKHLKCVYFSWRKILQRVAILQYVKSFFFFSNNENENT